MIRLSKKVKFIFLADMVVGLFFLSFFYVKVFIAYFY